jgi:hypothetical protein
MVAHIKAMFQVEYTVSGLNRCLHQHQLSCMQHKPIKTTGCRTRLNIVDAIRLGHIEDVVIVQYDKTDNGESIVDFLTKIRDTYSTSGSIHTCPFVSLSLR